MAKQTWEINLHWRNENYGRYSDTVAFRGDIDPYPSDSRYKAISRLYKKAGFEGDQSRGAWIARNENGDVTAKLVSLLESEGYTLNHFGCVPEQIASASSPKM